jgi:FkbM family methyltransferase
MGASSTGTLSGRARRAFERLPAPARKHLRDAAVIATNRHGERRALVRGYAFRLAGLVTPTVTVESDGARFVLNTADREVSRILFIHGAYERRLMEQVFAVLSSVNGRPFDLDGRLFLDVGANIGSATVEACVHFGAAGGAAFEPGPDNFRYLRRNLAANGLEGRVTAHRLAISDREGEVALEISEIAPGDHRVRAAEPRANAFGERERPVTTVAARTLDSLVEEGAIDLERVGLVWIDVQGHEPNVLAGAASLTAADVPVVIEYWPYGLRSAGALERLEREVAARYTHYVDIRERPASGALPGMRPVSELNRLAQLYPDPLTYTDLVLLKR